MIKLQKHIKGYDSYKDSWVEWIGNIPSDWETKKIKFFCVVKRWASPRPIDDLRYFDDENWEYWWVRISDVTASGKYLNITEQKLSDLWKSFSVPLLPWEFVISIAWSVWKQIITNIKCCIHDGFVYLKWLKLNKNYLFLIFEWWEIYKWLWKLWTQLNLNSETIWNLVIPIMSNEIQLKITEYLDEKLNIINSIIEKKQKQIELLQERRSSVINKAVTKWLDSNVEMKDSWIEWIGEISNKFNLAPLKRLVKIKITDWPHLTPEFIDDDIDAIPFISAESIKDNRIDFNYRRWNISKELHEEFCKKCKPLKDDIFIIKSGSTTGRIAMVEVDFEFNIWSPLALVRARQDRCIPKYLYYALQNDIFQNQVQLFWSFWTQPNIWMWILEVLMITLPTLEDQIRIIEYIEKETLLIDEMIWKVKESIELLKEYKFSFISNVITGKVKVI